MGLNKVLNFPLTASTETSLTCFTCGRKYLPGLCRYFFPSTRPFTFLGDYWKCDGKSASFMFQVYCLHTVIDAFTVVLTRR